MKLLSSYKYLLKKYNARPLKQLGQNFLIDKKVLKRIIEAAKLKPTDIILEIGPGLGVLTIELAKKVKQVVAVEKDKKIYEILKKILKNYRNIEIINEDILKIASPRLVSCGLKNYKVIANLPYYITAPVIRKFLECNEARPRCMVLMVQKEVAQRITAKPPKMSILAVGVQFYAEPKIMGYVSRNSFWPQPKVDSAILRIVPQRVANLPAENHKKFFEIVKAGFSSKRKMLKNNLEKKLKIKSQKLKVIFEKLNINPKTRAENLSAEDWIKLLKMI